MFRAGPSNDSPSMGLATLDQVVTLRRRDRKSAAPPSEVSQQRKKRCHAGSVDAGRREASSRNGRGAGRSGPAQVSWQRRRPGTTGADRRRELFDTVGVVGRMSAVGGLVSLLGTGSRSSLSQRDSISDTVTLVDECAHRFAPSVRRSSVVARSLLRTAVVRSTVDVAVRPLEVRRASDVKFVGT